MPHLTGCWLPGLPTGCPASIAPAALAWSILPRGQPGLFSLCARDAPEPARCAERWGAGGPDATAAHDAASACRESGAAHNRLILPAAEEIIGEWTGRAGARETDGSLTHH